MRESPLSSPPVRPRVVSQLTGEQLLLEDALEPVLERADAGAVCIFGPAGSGKSSALRSLRPRLPKRLIVELLDEPDPAAVAELAERMVVIYAAPEPFRMSHLAKLGLAPWGEDEAIEYLLAVHRERCASVVRRLRASGERTRLDSPRLWTLCLDRMAEDEIVPDVDAALRRHLDQRLSIPLRLRAREICFAKASREETPGVDEVLLWGHRGFFGFLMGGGLSAEDVKVIRDPRVRRLLAAEQLVDPDNGSVFLEGLSTPLEQPLLRVAGELLRGKRSAMAALESAIEGLPLLQPMGSSLLLAARPQWRPRDLGKIRRLRGARLRGAMWRELRLPNADFSHADLSNSSLVRASLDGASFASAHLRHAALSDASVRQINASHADLSGADLSRVSAEHGFFIHATLEGTNFEGAFLPGSRFLGANLKGARFCRADLKNAIFHMQAPFDDWIASFGSLEEMMRVYLKTKGRQVGDSPFRKTVFSEVDFSGADLTEATLQASDLRTAAFSGAVLTGANLRNSRLEGVEIPGARFERARLSNADLTGSVMPGASFHQANLGAARLAEIDWEKADLRDADLRRSTFHLGTSRSGLVFGSPSEGTRNGFYTDDFGDQSYRAPEEIRVANLRGADLRGALLEGTDFYLVDLREAVYSADQEAHFRRCGAILETRV
jgi:uncharacterized protein YjbI with pentapeptide repeats